MKLLLLPLLLLGAGAGWYSLDSPAVATTDDCDAGACRVEVECTGPDTCLVTCYDENGDVRCQQEVTCDEACDKQCDQPCDQAAKTAGTKACRSSPSCAR